MPDLRAVHDASTWFMIGVIWLVQLVHYPMFAHLDRASFAEGHAFHTGAISLVVIPGMFVELATAALLAWTRRDAPSLAGLALVGIIWASTFLIMVPLHGRLGAEGFRADIHASLVNWNWLRTLAWSARGAILFFWLPRS